MVIAYFKSVLNHNSQNMKTPMQITKNQSRRKFLTALPLATLAACEKSETQKSHPHKYVTKLIGKWLPLGQKIFQDWELEQTI